MHIYCSVNFINKNFEVTQKQLWSYIFDCDEPNSDRRCIVLQKFILRFIDYDRLLDIYRFSNDFDKKSPDTVDCYIKNHSTSILSAIKKCATGCLKDLDENCYSDLPNRYLVKFISFLTVEDIKLLIELMKVKYKKWIEENNNLSMLNIFLVNFFDSFWSKVVEKLSPSQKTIDDLVSSQELVDFILNSINLLSFIIEPGTRKAIKEDGKSFHGFLTIFVDRVSFFLLSLEKVFPNIKLSQSLKNIKDKLKNKKVYIKSRDCGACSNVIHNKYTICSYLYLIYDDLIFILNELFRLVFDLLLILFQTLKNSDLKNKSNNVLGGLFDWLEIGNEDLRLFNELQDFLSIVDENFIALVNSLSELFISWFLPNITKVLINLMNTEYFKNLYHEIECKIKLYAILNKMKEEEQKVQHKNIEKGNICQNELGELCKSLLVSVLADKRSTNIDKALEVLREMDDNNENLIKFLMNGEIIFSWNRKRKYKDMDLSQVLKDTGNDYCKMLGYLGYNNELEFKKIDSIDFTKLSKIIEQIFSYVINNEFIKEKSPLVVRVAKLDALKSLRDEYMKIVSPLFSSAINYYNSFNGDIMEVKNFHIVMKDVSVTSFVSSDKRNVLNLCKISGNLPSIISSTAKFHSKITEILNEENISNDLGYKFLLAFLIEMDQSIMSFYKSDCISRFVPDRVVNENKERIKKNLDKLSEINKNESRQKNKRFDCFYEEDDHLLPGMKFKQQNEEFYYLYKDDDYVPKDVPREMEVDDKPSVPEIDLSYEIDVDRKDSANKKRPQKSEEKKEQLTKPSKVIRDVDVANYQGGNHSKNESSKTEFLHLSRKQQILLVFLWFCLVLVFLEIFERFRNGKNQKNQGNKGEQTTFNKKDSKKEEEKDVIDESTTEEDDL